MTFGFNPVPKPEIREKKKKGLSKMKPYNKKTPKEQKKAAPKKKKLQKAIRNGVKPPSPKMRGMYSDEDYQKAVLFHGRKCCIPNCKHSAQEMHHPYFRGNGGRGVWTNALPLCMKHHDYAHEHKRTYNKILQEYCEQLFGPFYYMDMWDLWLKGHISDPNKQEFEKFMEVYYLKCQSLRAEAQNSLWSKIKMYNLTLVQQTEGC